MVLSVDDPDPEDPTDRPARRPGLVGLDARRTSSRRATFPSSETPGATRPGCSTTPRAAATSSRGSSSACAHDPAIAIGHDHDIRAARGHEYIPCVSMLDFWSPAGRARARRLRAQPRLRQEGVRKPRRARPAAADGRAELELPVGRRELPPADCPCDRANGVAPRRGDLAGVAAKWVLRGLDLDHALACHDKHAIPCNWPHQGRTGKLAKGGQERKLCAKVKTGQGDLLAAAAVDETAGWMCPANVYVPGVAAGW